VQLPDFASLTAASGPLAVFLLFLSPISPGAIAGILLARAYGLSASLTIALYLASDIVTAAVLDPVLVRLTQRAHRSAFGERFLATFRQVGTLTQVTPGRFGLPVGLFVCTFATDFFTAAIISMGLALSRIVAWTSIIAGDFSWFLIIYLASAGLASFLSDNRIIFILSLVLGLGLPWLIRRLLGRRLAPALNPPERPLDPRFRPKGEADPGRSRVP
jgi:hypothetical protein